MGFQLQVVHLVVRRRVPVRGLPPPLQGLLTKLDHDPQHEGALGHPDLDHHGRRHCRHDLRCSHRCLLSDHDEDVQDQEEAEEEGEPTSLFTVDKEKVELDLRTSSNSSTSNRTLNTSASTTDNNEHSGSWVKHDGRSKSKTRHKSSDNVNPAERRVASQLWREQASQLRVPGELRGEQQPELPQPEEQSPAKWTRSENAKSSLRGLCR